MTTRRFPRVEWPTLLLVLACYGLWGVALWILPQVSLAAAILLAALAIAQFASLQHEVIHGHPFTSQRANAALVWPALALVIPYARFRDTHLAHHRDAILTDPYDDPESNYLDPDHWQRLPAPLRGLLAANNTLLGRIVLGPLVGQVSFAICEWRLARAGDRSVLRGWAEHLPPMALVLILVAGAPMPFWAYLVAVHGALSLLKIRTFLEHQAHEKARGRSVIVEDRGPLALLFLNNNLHVVHHMHPRVPWYRLPALYAARPAHYLGVNGGYRYRSYAEVFARHLLRAKDPVAHPLWRRAR